MTPAIGYTYEHVHQVQNVKIVIGGLVGAATALILAPQSGQETRGQIANRSQDLRSTSGERLGQYRQLAGDYTSTARERAQEIGGQVQQQARIVLDKGRDQTQASQNGVDVAQTDLPTDSPVDEGDAPQDSASE